MYNKHRFFKANDKKILHKVKKQWVTISLALLMAIGGGVVATHASTYADSINNADTTAIKSAAPQQQKSIAQSSSSSNSNITSQAKLLHTSLISKNILTSFVPNTIQTGNYQGLNYRYNPSRECQINCVKFKNHSRDFY